jgi:hypothetical protein
MQADDIQKYLALIEEIKLRVKAIDGLLANANSDSPQFISIESIGLQFRKVLELIAFSSLISNKVVYTAAYDDFSKTWNAELLMKDLERVNPDFYPQPVIEHRNPEVGVTAMLEPMKSGFLTLKAFVKVYKKCGALVHASNPNGSKLDYKFYSSRFPIWREEIVNLLKSHRIRLTGSESFYLIHAEERHNGKAHHYTLEPKVVPGT